jgi:hypothetical protein
VGRDLISSQLADSLDERSNDSTAIKAIFDIAIMIKKLLSESVMVA